MRPGGGTPILHHDWTLWATPFSALVEDLAKDPLGVAQTYAKHTGGSLARSTKEERFCPPMMKILRVQAEGGRKPTVD